MVFRSGHIGVGNLHINVLRPEGMDGAEFVAQCGRVTTLLADTLQRHGGSISAEHGIGLVKKPYLPSTRSQAEIEVMRGIRRVLDPHGIMNPGKLFDPRSEEHTSELQSLMRISYAVFCLTKKKTTKRKHT